MVKEDEEEKKEPLHKTYKSFDAGPEDRTSQEEIVARAKLGMPPRTTEVVREGPKRDEVVQVLDKHLNGAVQFLVCLSQTSDTQLDGMGPPDPMHDTARMQRDKKLYLDAKGAYLELCSVLSLQVPMELWRRVERNLKGAHERVRALHQRLCVAKQCRVIEMMSYEPTTPRLHYTISGAPIPSHEPYVELDCVDGQPPAYVTRDEHLHLAALHVAWHFVDYLWMAVEEQRVRAVMQGEERPDSLYQLWVAWAGGAAPANKFMGATPMWQRIIQFREMLLSTMGEAGAE